MGLDDLFKVSNSNIPKQPATEYARAYIRVSHEQSADKQTSPETQRRLIEEYALKHQYVIKGWYQDLAKSAFKNEAARTEFLRLIKDAKSDPETSLILVFRYDRFSRSMSAPTIQQELLSHGVRIESVEEGYYDPDTEVGSIMGAITWSFNRTYSLKLRSIVVLNMATNAGQRDSETNWAFKNGGRAMWGYKIHRIKVGRSAKYTDVHKAIWLKDDTVVAGKPVWEWARIVLVEWRLKEGLGYRKIADKLTELGVPTPRGRTGWSASTVSYLVAEWDKLLQFAGFGLWNRRNWQNEGQVKLRDTSEWVRTKDAHPAIITEEECRALIELARKTSEHGKATKPESPFILSGGILKCASCGSNLAGAPRHGKNYYTCGAHLYRRGAGCGPAWYIPKDQLENLMFEKLLGRLSNEDGGLELWIEEHNASIDAEWEQLESTSSHRKQELARLENELDNLLNLAAAGEAIPELRQKIDEASGFISRLKRLDEVKKPKKLTLAEIQKTRNEIEAAFHSADLRIRKKALVQYIVEITADPETRKINGTLIDPRDAGGDGPQTKQEPPDNSDDSCIQTSGRAL